MGAALFTSSFFAQCEEGAAHIEEIDRDGVESWLDVLSGAIDFSEGETSDAAPWGRADTLEHEEHDSDSILRVHVNRAMGYVGVTLEWKETEE